MPGGPSTRERATTWARTRAGAVVARSYPLSKRVALTRFARRSRPPVVVFSMGKTGSTAVARAVATATGTPAFQVFRLDPVRLQEAEQRYRARAANASTTLGFPGAAHLWESAYLLDHPPTAAAPWTVITTVREPVAQSVSAFFHALRQSSALGSPASVAADVPVAALVERFVAERWVREPLRWFGREFAPALGIDALASPFDVDTGFGTFVSPAVRLLLLRQEDFATAPRVLAGFLGRTTPVVVTRRNEGGIGADGAAYRRFLDEARIPASVLDEAYESAYAQHFYANAQIAGFRQRWSRSGEPV